MVRKGGVPHQRSFVLERRYSVADGLGSIRWHSGSNDGANPIQGAAGRFRDASKVFVKILRSASAFLGRIALARFHFFHAGMLQEAPIQVYAQPSAQRFDIEKADLY